MLYDLGRQVGKMKFKAIWNNVLWKRLFYTPPRNSMHMEWMKWNLETCLGYKVARIFWPGFKAHLCADSTRYGRLPIISDYYLGSDRREEDHRNGAWGRKKWGHIWNKRKEDS